MTDWKLELGNAPVELVIDIASFLRGMDIIRLWMCGNKRLNYVMGDLGGVRRLSLQFPWTSDLYTWPVIISAFKKLEMVGMHLGRTASISQDALEAFKTWPKTITELCLSFRKAEGCWSKCQSISDYFPRLEILKLYGWSSFNGDSLQKLPVTLKSLDLAYNVGLSANALQNYLPINLEHLCLDNLQRLDEETALKLPRTLKTLSMHRATGINPRIISSLPHSLTDIRIRLSESPVSAIMAALPSGLKHFSCAFNWQEVCDFRLVAWPLSLETLVADGGIHFIKLSTLPTSLTFLEINVNQIELNIKNEMAALPRTLKSLVLPGPRTTQQCFSNEIVTVLPPALTELSTTWSIPINDQCVPHLPTYLRTLHLPNVMGITGKAFKFLPKYLTSLNLNSAYQIEDTDIADLPRWVLQLRIDSASQLTDQFAPHLPRCLEVLSIHSNGNFTFKCVPQLPLNMEDLDLGHTGVADKYNIEKKKRAKLLQ